MFKKFPKNIENIMYLPAIALLITFIILPFLKGFFISFTDFNGFSSNFNLIGFKKYIFIFKNKDTFVALKNTFIYGIGCTILQNIIGILLALFIHNYVKHKDLIKAIIYLPVIISPLMMGYIWYFFFQYDGGALNDILILLNKVPIDWLNNGPRAVKIITILNTLQFIGVSMVIYIAGLNNISKTYYEAAQIDGANKFITFRKITLPMLMPSVTVSIILNLIGGLKLFDIIIALTNGGPGYASNSLCTAMYDLYFMREDAGAATAMGTLMCILIAIISLIVLNTLRNKEIDYD